MSTYTGNDPVEKIIADALDDCGIDYESPCLLTCLDFRLMKTGVRIECKRFHSIRISDQMSRTENIIAVQGIEAAKLMARFIRGVHHERT